MRDEYDFSNSIKNPYLKKLKRQITIRIDDDTIKYFKTLADEVGMPYQNLINLYLHDCAENHKKIQVSWK
jgi:predicted DNA binding CopG/RHH family protein